ncbi:DUF4198 domain-containing protein [Pseudomonas migulae]|uniref:Cobalt/nickel transport protein n=1 Tax=Pseudomonas migulae TaxID=78543 RepID=A0A1H5KXJ5_9PSED|nr:cobalt/nickel transport protein [Pseudomonas migulae]
MQGGRGQLHFAVLALHPCADFPGNPRGGIRAVAGIQGGGLNVANNRLQLVQKTVEPIGQLAQFKITRRGVMKRQQAVRSLGDHIFVLEPEPYLETEEDVYIQQFTKLIVNVGGVPSDWAEPQGLPVEIQPLSKPYANWTGGVFRALVLADGKPVPFAEIEIEYVNHSVDIKNNAFGKQDYVTAPQASFKSLSTYSDAQGIVTIGLPRAGWWGIAALNIGTTKTHKSKPLSQDAILWVQARDMK